MLRFFQSDIVKFNQIQKITLAGVLMALIVIFNKVIAVNYIIPFARISFGSIALIILSSLCLGPWYGLLISAGADVIGYFVFDASSFGWFPQITATYALLGLLPFFFYKIVKNIKSKKMIIFVEYSTFAVIFSILCVFFSLNNTIDLYGKVHEILLYQKLLVLGISLLLFALIIVTNYIISKKSKDDDISIYHVSFVVFLSEIFINLLFGSLMKAWAFGFNMFIPIIIIQGVIMFFNIPYNTYLLFAMIKAIKKYNKQD